MKDRKPYTIIGFYQDNNQPWMEHTTESQLCSR